MQNHLANRLLLVQPAAFGFNAETAASNGFQQHHLPLDVHERALAEFHALTAALTEAEIDFEVLLDTPAPAKPDAIFPNNWFSTHEGGKLFLYPMATPNRQAEVLSEHVAWLEKQGYTQLTDLRHHISEQKYLEGTGSLVFDHAHRLVYANHSLRTDGSLVRQVAEALGYKAVLFEAVDRAGAPIYHTNVVLSVSPQLAIACFKALPDADEAALLAALLERNGRHVVAVTREQMEAFCCNALVVANTYGKPMILLSETAWQAFTAYQQLWIAERAEPVVAAIPTIEAVGGGSVRCMVAELN